MDSTMDLGCPENCIDPEHPKLYPDITAGKFLEDRLKEIGFYPHPQPNDFRI